MKPCFIIDGVDYIDCISMKDGLAWECNDLDSSESVRTMDGLMHRKRITQKRKIKVSLVPLTTERFKELCDALSTEYVEVTLLDPKEGYATTFTFYGSSIQSAIMSYDGNNTFWSGGKFNLIER